MNFLRAKIFDSTLRDGAQAEGISFLVGDKIKIAKALDDLGVDFIEAGNPGSNQKIGQSESGRRSTFRRLCRWPLCGRSSEPVRL